MGTVSHYHNSIRCFSSHRGANQADVGEIYGILGYAETQENKIKLFEVDDLLHLFQSFLEHGMLRERGVAIQE